MEIHIGKAPDFKMMRGKELLTYSLIVKVQSQKSAYQKSFSHFSLVMVCKNLQSVRLANNADSEPEESMTRNIVQIMFWGNNKSRAIVARFTLPPALTGSQREEIRGFICDYFDVAKQTAGI